MERFSTAQRILFVKTFCENGECATQAMQKLRTSFGRNDAPCESNVRRLMTKFETTGSALNVKSLGRSVLVELETAYSYMEGCDCYSKKICSPMFAVDGYPDHFIALNFA